MKLIGERETTEEISVNSYLGTLMFGSFPIIGLILLYRWSKDANVRKNKQNLCRAFIKLRFMFLYPLGLIYFILGMIIGKILFKV